MVARMVTQPKDEDGRLLGCSAVLTRSSLQTFDGRTASIIRAMRPLKRR
jgi:hypothetical protein